MEVNSEESPLALNSVTHRFDSRDMERHKSCWRIRNQNRVTLDIDIDLSRDDVLGVAVNIFVAAQVSHLLHLFLF